MEQYQTWLLQHPLQHDLLLVHVAVVLVMVVVVVVLLLLVPQSGPPRLTLPASTCYCRAVLSLPTQQ